MDLVAELESLKTDVSAIETLVARAETRVRAACFPSPLPRKARGRRCSRQSTGRYPSRCRRRATRGYLTCEPCRTRGLRSSRDRWLRSQYGLSREAYEALLAAQAGLCAICGVPPGH